MLAEGRSYSGRERNCSFLNTGSNPVSQNRFATISAASQLDLIDDSRAIAVVDWNHDGALDLVVSGRTAPRLRVLINQYARTNEADAGKESDGGNSAGNYVAVMLQGDGQMNGVGRSTNRDAIGARVEVVTEESQQQGLRNIQTLRAGEGFLSQSSKTLVFGLGSDTRIKKILVHWPGTEFATPEEFDVDQVNTRYRLIQGSGSAERIEPHPTIRLEASMPQANPRTNEGRIRYQLQLPIPPLQYHDLKHRERTRTLDSKRPVLIVLWSSDCHLCQHELQELATRSREINNVDLDVIALSMDAISPEGSVDNAKRFLDQLKFPFETGFATASFVDQLQEVYNHSMPLHSPLPIPASFMLDQRGRLSVLYKGEVNVDDVLSDLNHLTLDAPQRFANSAALPGRTLDHPIIHDVLRRQEAAARSMFANRLNRAGEHELAIAEYQEILKYRPDFATARYAIGDDLVQRGKIAEAKQFYSESLIHLPRDQKLHAFLADLSMREGDIDKAEYHFHKSVEFKPDSAECHVNYGNILLYKNQLEKAEHHFREAIRLRPGFADAHHNLGNVAFKRQDLVTARKHYEEALRLQPDFAEAHCNLGNLFASQSKFDEAIKCYYESLRIRPDYQEAKRSLARVMMLKKRSAQ